MAKRKRSKRRTHATRRRRSVGAIGLPSASALKEAAGVVVGLMAAAKGSSMLPDSLNDQVKSAVITAIGGVLLGQKNEIVKGAALGITAVGAYKLASSLLPSGSLPAIGFANYNNRYLRFDSPVSGFNSYPNNPQLNTVAGFNNYPNNPQRNTIAGVTASKTAGAGL